MLEEQETLLDKAIHDIQTDLENRISHFSPEEIVASAPFFPNIKTMLEYRYERDDVVADIQKPWPVLRPRSYFDDLLKRSQELATKDQPTVSYFKKLYAKECERVKMLRSLFEKRTSGAELVVSNMEAIVEYHTSLSEYSFQCDSVNIRLSTGPIVSYTKEDVELAKVMRFLKRHKTEFIKDVEDQIRLIPLTKRYEVLTRSIDLKPPEVSYPLPIDTQEELDDDIIRIGSFFGLTGNLTSNEGEEFLYKCESLFPVVWDKIKKVNPKPYNFPNSNFNCSKSSSQFSMHKAVNSLFELVSKAKLPQILSYIKEETANQSGLLSANGRTRRAKPLSADRLTTWLKMMVLKARYLLVKISCTINYSHALLAKCYGAPLEIRFIDATKDIWEVLNGDTSIVLSTAQNEFDMAKNRVMRTASKIMMQPNMDAFHVIELLLEKELAYAQALVSLAEPLYEISRHTGTTESMNILQDVLSRSPECIDTAETELLNSKSMFLKKMIVLQFIEERRVAHEFIAAPLFERPSTIECGETSTFDWSHPTKICEIYPNLGKIPKLLRCVYDAALDLHESFDMKDEYLVLLQISIFRLIDFNYSKCPASAQIPAISNGIRQALTDLNNIETMYRESREKEIICKLKSVLIRQASSASLPIPSFQVDHSFNLSSLARLRYDLEASVRFNCAAADCDFLCNYFSLSPSALFLTETPDQLPIDKAKQVLRDPSSILLSYRHISNDRSFYFVCAEGDEALAAAYKVECMKVINLIKKTTQDRSYSDVFLYSPRQDQTQAEILSEPQILSESGSFINHFALPSFIEVFSTLKTAAPARQSEVFRALLSFELAILRLVTLTAPDSNPATRLSAELNRLPMGKEPEVAAKHAIGKADLYERRLYLALMLSRAANLSKASPAGDQRASTDAEIITYLLSETPTTAFISERYIKQIAPDINDRLLDELNQVDDIIATHLTNRQLHSVIECSPALSESENILNHAIIHQRTKFALGSCYGMNQTPKGYLLDMSGERFVEGMRHWIPSGDSIEDIEKKLITEYNSAIQQIELFMAQAQKAHLKTLADTFLSARFKGDGFETALVSLIKKGKDAPVEGFFTESFSIQKLGWLSEFQRSIADLKAAENGIIFINLHSRLQNEAFIHTYESECAARYKDEFLLLSKLKDQLKQIKQENKVDTINFSEETKEEFTNLVSDLGTLKSKRTKQFSHQRNYVLDRIQAKISEASNQLITADRPSPADPTDETNKLKQKVMVSRIVRTLSSIATKRFFDKRMDSYESERRRETTRLWKAKAEAETEERVNWIRYLKAKDSLYEATTEIERLRSELEGGKQATIKLVHWKHQTLKRETELKEKIESLGKVTNVTDLIRRIEEGRETLNALKAEEEKFSVKAIRQTQSRIDKVRRNIRETQAKSRPVTRSRVVESPQNSLLEENMRLQNKNEALRRILEKPLKEGNRKTTEVKLKRPVTSPSPRVMSSLFR